MKRFNLTLFLILCLGRWAGAGDSIFVNNGALTAQTNIDATVLINHGLIYFDLLNSDVVNGTLFQTRDTLYFTNTGTMVLQPGLNFNSVTAKGTHSAGSFYNSGSILAVDAPMVAFDALIGTIPVLVPPGAAGAGTNTPFPSALVISATNITVSGAMSVGDDGLMQFNGSAIKLNNGILKAGTISEVDTNATLDRGTNIGILVGGALSAFFDPPVDVYDVYWAVTNGPSELDNLDDFAAFVSVNPPLIDVSYPTNTLTRNGTLEGYPLLNYSFVPGSFFPISTLLPLGGTTPTVTTPPVAPNFVSYVYSYLAATNTATPNVGEFYYNIIFVNSAFADADITSQVEFLTLGGLIVTNGDPNAIEGMIKFSAPVLDITSGQTVTNSIYFLDTSAIQVAAFLATNSVYQSDGEPLGFEITRSQPVEWPLGVPADDVFNENVLYEAGIFQNITAPMTNSFYCAMVGRDPEVPSGLFDYAATILGTTQTGMPNLTNEGARIEITAAKSNDVSNLTLSANGVVKMNSPVLLGTPAAVDFGNMNVDLGNLKSALLVSNLFPGTFHRLRGDIAAYAASWVNTQTNDGLGTLNSDRITNHYHIHVLILDQDLRDTFQTTGLNVALRGSNVVVDDPLRVMGSALFQAANLTFNSNLHLTYAAGALQVANVPGIKNLLIGSGGSVAADNSINLGVVPGTHPVNPTKQNTSILSITNLGRVSSQEVEFQSQILANGGSILATNFGSIVINAITNYLGAGTLGLTNSLTADGDINLTSTSIQITNSTITAGQAGHGQLVLYATGELTDHLPNTASTNVYNTNVVQVTDGFSLPVKPANGDLFGTQITSIAATAGQTIHHVWAGQDLGATLAGFYNNEVIGHLILDRATNATFQFSAAGKKNAMYVDFLDLQGLLSDNYHQGLVIDPNLTIYFATANVEPIKLHEAYTNLVWVPQFAGPNSTTNVSYLGGSNCLMNAALAASSVIDSDFDGIVNLNDSFLLNNPNVGPVPCPSLVNSTETLSVANGVAGQTFVIWTTGNGIITPNLAQKGVAVGKMNTLTAVPASGWLFLGWSGAVVSTLPTITFPTPVQPFSFLTANFITNPFIGLAGVYHGLFSVPGSVGGNDSGSVTFTVNSHGVFSGKLTIGTANYPFSSQFNIANFASFSATNGPNVLVVSMQVTNTTPPGQITGMVTNANFQASLTAYQEPVWTTARPAPQAGTYTLVLPGNADASASPGGDGYGTVTVDKTGNLTTVGTLADNVSFSQSVKLSQNGQWPLYFSPAGVAQPVLGWVTFDTNGVGGTSAGFSGTVTWVKAAGPGTFYPNGFTNSSVLLGSIYSAAFQKTNGLALSSPTITLSGGNLALNVTEAVTVSGLQTYQSADKSLTLIVNPATGGFTGTYVTPGTGKKVPLAGVVLQVGGVARGFFLGTNQSGAVLLQGN